MSESEGRTQPDKYEEGKIDSIHKDEQEEEDEAVAVWTSESKLATMEARMADLSAMVLDMRSKMDVVTRENVALKELHAQDVMMIARREHELDCLVKSERSAKHDAETYAEELAKQAADKIERVHEFDAKIKREREMREVVERKAAELIQQLEADRLAVEEAIAKKVAEIKEQTQKALDESDSKWREETKTMMETAEAKWRVERENMTREFENRREQDGNTHSSELKAMEHKFNLAITAQRVALSASVEEAIRQAQTDFVDTLKKILNVTGWVTIGAGILITLVGAMTVSVTVAVVGGCVVISGLVVRRARNSRVANNIYRKIANKMIPRPVLPVPTPLSVTVQA